MLPCPTTRACLLARIRDFDHHEAWSEFVALYRPAIYRLGRLRGLQKADAQDLVQSVLDLAKLLDSLAPTEDPRMLGRLSGFEIVGVIGSGGMGIVLKAFEPALARYIAIKVLNPDLWQDETARQRFAREARAAASVVHDNVIEIYSVDTDSQIPYFTMPYLRGETLAQRIFKRGALGTEEVLRISRQLAAGIAAAHRQGLVHRDIKPANFFLTQGAERIRITDFWFGIRAYR